MVMCAQLISEDMVPKFLFHLISITSTIFPYLPRCGMALMFKYMTVYQVFVMEIQYGFVKIDTIS